MLGFWCREGLKELLDGGGWKSACSETRGRS